MRLQGPLPEGALDHGVRGAGRDLQEHVGVPLPVVGGHLVEPILRTPRWRRLRLRRRRSRLWLFLLDQVLAALQLQAHPSALGALAGEPPEMQPLPHQLQLPDQGSEGEPVRQHRGGGVLPLTSHDAALVRAAHHLPDTLHLCEEVLAALQLQAHPASLWALPRAPPEADAIAGRLQLLDHRAEGQALGRLRRSHVSAQAHEDPAAAGPADNLPEAA
mmetsp:Transcript_33955/g.97639  ORF Transcript_33955/g.97639 Transcript_33955/m.97639 type:complete len:217 (+) Transcript_33955:1645-2295(+)